MNVFAAHRKMAAMKMKLAGWIKRVDCGNLGSFKSLISFMSDENKSFGCKINNGINSLTFEVGCTCLSRTLGNGGFFLYLQETLRSGKMSTDLFWQS